MYDTLRLTVLAMAVALAACAPQPADDAAPAAGDSTAYRDEVLARLGTIESKIVGLAEAMPADKYEWRPMEGVRSVSELFLHVAGANFGLSQTFGTPPPEGLDMSGYEDSTTDKAEIVPAVKDSFAHMKGAIEKLSGADAEETVKMFGGETTTRGALLNTVEHLSEHLGQAIAYARVNEVVPPWTAARANN